MMRNQLVLSGEQIVEKVYPQLLHHVGMIRGEYLLRELNQNILLASCQQFVKDYLDPFAPCTQMKRFGIVFQS